MANAVQGKVIKWLLKRHGPSTQPVVLRGNPPPPIGEWNLKAVAAAVATTREPGARQTKEVWKALETARLPGKVRVRLGTQRGRYPGR